MAESSAMAMLLRLSRNPRMIKYKMHRDYYKATGNGWSWSDQMLEPAKKTLDNLCAGDFVRRSYGVRKVLAAIDGCYLLSEFEDYNSTSAWYTVHDLKEFGYSVIKSTAPEPTIEINNKKYNKADVEKAIKDLEPVE